MLCGQANKITAMPNANMTRLDVRAVFMLDPFPFGAAAQALSAHARVPALLILRRNCDQSQFCFASGEYLITKRSVNLGKKGGWKRDRTSSQTVASGDFVNKTIVIEFANQAAVDKLFNFDVRRFRIEQSHQSSDVSHSIQVRDRFPLDAGKIVLIPLFPHCRIAYLKPPHHGFDHDRLVGRRHAESQTLNQGHKDPLGSFRTLLQKLRMHDHSLVEDRNLGWLEFGDGREALASEPADQGAVEHRRIHSTRFQRLANQYRVADAQDIDVVAFWIEADIL